MIQIASILVVILGMMLTVSACHKWVQQKRKCVILWIIFGIYAAGNLYFTLLSRKQSPVVYLDFLPFRAYSHLFQIPEDNSGTATGFAGNFLKGTLPIVGLILNILLYYPLGYLLAILFPRLKTRHIILIGCLCSIATEATQYILKIGWCETDDVIHNALGTAIGLWVWRWQIKHTIKWNTNTAL